MIRHLITIIVFSLLLTSDAMAAENPGWWKGDDTPAFAGGVIREAYCDVISYMEGNFGGMLMAAAGILAMATAAFGNFKHAATAAGVGIASFTMSAVVGLYFGQLCGGGGGGGAPGARVNTDQARIAQEQNIDAPDIDFESEEATETEAKDDPFDI